MLWAVFFFALMNVCVKALPGIPAMEVVFFRCAVSIVLSFIWLRKLGVNVWGQRRNRWRLWGRGISGTIALFMFFLTVQKMPLASAVTVQYLSPIFTAIIAMIFLREKIKPVQWLFFAISFAGVVALKGFDERISWFYLGIGIAAAVLAGVAYTFVRSMSGREHPLVIVFYFQVVGTLLGGAYSLYEFVVPTLYELAILIGIGLAAHVAQVFLTKALQGEKAGVVTSLNFFGAVYAAIFGWLLFGEHLTLGNVLAIAMVITGVLLNITINAGRGQRVWRFFANLMNR
ncbi:MAG: DMT family transporter [Bacteroidetes bacterium]|nr:MAG: DMT family transporter [Bacteroidota bacterium]